MENPQQYITRVGRILRKTSLDELPQIFQIFTGKMAVIGPRPALWNQYDLIAQRDLYGANDVRPGLTGWAQINGRDELPIDVKARLDGEYVKKMSFLFDCKCFFGSITAVLKHEGVVEKPYFQDGMEAVWENVKGDAEKTAKKRRVGPIINLLLDVANQVLHGSYKYVDGEERLYLDSANYVKINLASSGQQEVVWIFNLLFYYLLEEKKVFLILEEPESHLYPESQRLIAEVLSLFANSDKQILITTRSPYVLGTFNYLLIAAQCPEQHQAELSKSIHKRMRLEPQKSGAYFIQNGSLDNILAKEDDLTLIKNEVIDGASAEINNRSDIALELLETGDV